MRHSRDAAFAMSAKACPSCARAEQSVAQPFRARP